MADVSATLDLADRWREADEPHSQVVRFPANAPLRLDAGIDFAPLQIAYQTYARSTPTAAMPCSSATRSPAISTSSTTIR